MPSPPFFQESSGEVVGQRSSVSKLYWVGSLINVAVAIVFQIIGWPLHTCLALVIVLHVAWAFFCHGLVKRREATELIALRSDMSELNEIKRRCG